MTALDQAIIRAFAPRPTGTVKQEAVVEAVAGAAGILPSGATGILPSGATGILPVPGVGQVANLPLGTTGILPAAGTTGILPAAGAAGILPAAGATGILPVPRTDQVAKGSSVRQIGTLPHSTGETPMAQPTFPPLEAEPSRVGLRLDSASTVPPRPASVLKTAPRSEIVTAEFSRPEVFTTAPARPAVPLSQALAELAAAQPAHATVATVSLDSLMSQSVKRPAAKTVRKPSGSRGPVESQVESNPVPPAPKIPEATKALKPESEPMNETTMTYRADPGLSTLPPLPPLGQVQAVPPPHLSMTATEPEPAAEPLRWRPMLQVDELLWPSVEDRLRTLAARWMDQLAAGLTNVLERGQKVLGFGCRTSGEGVTTLLTGAARRLVEQGLRVAVVDANLAGPNLAQSLGLLPQVGWADMLEGRLPLEEVAVESLADGLVVLPLAEPLEGVALEPTRIAATLQTLAESYDVVLVDLGALESSESSGTQREIARRMDAVLLVQNVRSTAADRLAGLRCDLAAEGVVHAGTIQNFVAG